MTIGIVQQNPTDPIDTVLYYAIANEKDRPSILSKLQRVNPKTGQPYTETELRSVPSIQVSKQDLEQLIPATRLQNPSMRFAINADKRLSYGLVDDIMRIMQKYGATRFNLVTTIQG